MSQIRELHEKAMEFYDEAFFAKRNGDDVRAKVYSLKAFELEKEAAEFLKNDLRKEPSRSILYKGAAVIAINCGKNYEALQLINRALKGTPPYEIKRELEELSETAARNIKSKNKKNKISTDAPQKSILSTLKSRALMTRDDKMGGRHISHRRRRVSFGRRASVEYGQIKELEISKTMDRSTRFGTVSSKKKSTNGDYFVLVVSLTGYLGRNQHKTPERIRLRVDKTVFDAEIGDVVEMKMKSIINGSRINRSFARKENWQVVGIIKKNENEELLKSDLKSNEFYKHK